MAIKSCPIRRGRKFIIVNTCGFIQSAKEEAISTLFEMAGYKQTGCCRLLVATGCFAQRYPEAIREEMPEVDVIMGVNDYQKLDEALREAEKGGRPVYTDDDGQFHEFGRVLTTRSTAHTSALARAATTGVPTARFR